MFISSSVNAPGIPPVCQPIIPAIFPAKLEVKSLLEDFKSIGRTVVIAETTLSFFCSPNATTVTSSIFSAVGFKRIFSLSFPLISTVSVLYPIKETRNTSSGLAAIV